MNVCARGCLIVALLLGTSQPLPAPITEEPEEATPPPPQSEEPATPKPKAKSRPKSTDSESGAKIEARSTPKPTSTPILQGPAKFAGAWSGTIKQGLLGNVKVPLIFDPTATSVKMTGGPRVATVNGPTISWKSGLLNDVRWTLTPNNDGTTAEVTCHSSFGKGSATFSRDKNVQIPDSTAPATQPAAQQTATSPSPQTQMPVAKAVPDKPGFVYNPFDSTSNVLLDTKGYAPGSKVKDPTTGKLFIVPQTPGMAAQTTPNPDAMSSKPSQTELPTAKPVPGKPGFVYNPFDPNATVFLDVRGKASGAKVKDPFSGKIFIVP